MAKKNPNTKKVEVILLERIKTLGDKYQVVKVAPIFARNVLLPKGQALPATAHYVTNLKNKITKHNTEKSKEADHVKAALEKIEANGGLIITRKINEKQHLFDKIDARDLAHLINEEYKTHLDDAHVKMPHKIDMIGQYHVTVSAGDFSKEIMIDVQPE